MDDSIPMSELSEEQKLVHRVLLNIDTAFSWRYKDIEGEITRSVDINPEYALSRRALLDELARMRDEIVKGVCQNYNLGSFPEFKRRFMSFSVIFDGDEPRTAQTFVTDESKTLCKYVSSSMQLQSCLVSIGRAKSGKLGLTYSMRFPSMLPAIKMQMIHEVLAGVGVKFTELRDNTHFDITKMLFDANSLSAIIRTAEHLLSNHPRHLVWKPHQKV